MRAHLFQHVPFEGLGSIASWIEAHGAVATATRFFEDAVLPELDDIDLLIVMGGPMSVNDEALHPWLSDEKRFIKEAIRRGTAVLGVCLGAQLIAIALGARVYPNTEREIGWFPIYSVPPPAKGAAVRNPVFNFPEELKVLQWHGETFDLPCGAVLLARSEACPNQAFQYGRRAIGLQFHLETTPQTIRELVSNGRSELIPGKYVQSEEGILSISGLRYEEINGLMDDLLSFLVGAESGGRGSKS